MPAKQHTTDPLGPLKRCAMCGAEKPRTLDYFYFKKHTSDQLEAWCKACYKIYNTTYRCKHQERLLKEALQYYYANHERIRAKQNAAYPQRTEEQKHGMRVSRLKYNVKHPELIRTTYHRYIARKNGLPNTFTEEEWRACQQYFGFACAICERLPELFGLKLSMDHWIPLSSPACPGTVPWNILPLCIGDIGNCNQSKSNRDGKTWLFEKLGKVRAGKKLREIETYFSLFTLKVKD